MNTSFAITSFFVGGLLIGNLAVMADRSQRDFEHEVATNEVANEVANGVVNNTANVVTTIETEVYRVVCVEPADTFCREYSVRRVNRE